MSQAPQYVPPALLRDRERGGPAQPGPLPVPEIGTEDPSATNPDYDEFVGEYREMRDAIRGASAIYAAGPEYLPIPSGFTMDAAGAERYRAYLVRAQFPEITAPTIRGMIGIMHRREATIKIPPDLEHLWENANGRGLPLEALHQLITTEILSVGRVGLLADAPKEGGDPKIKLYRAEDIRNWSSEDDFFILYEGGRERQGFRWRPYDKWRVLELDQDGAYVQRTYLRGQAASEPIVPKTGRLGKTLSTIPFSVAGVGVLSTDPESPPLIGVARSAVAIYRLDADLRHQLFSSGQETLFISGIEASSAPTVVGASVIVTLPREGRAEYVGPSGSGIDAHENAIKNERENAAALGSRVFDAQRQGGAESGEALRIRAGATTATLVGIANSSAKVLESALRNVGRLQGLGDGQIEKIVVTADTSFVDNSLSPADAKNLVSMWQGGAISYETLYWNLQKGEIATAERTAQEEQDLIEAETPDGAGALGDQGPGGLPAGADTGGADTGDGSSGPSSVSDAELTSIFGSKMVAEANAEQASSGNQGKGKP